MAATPRESWSQARKRMQHLAMVQSDLIYNVTIN